MKIGFMLKYNKQITLYPFRRFVDGIAIKLSTKALIIVF